MQLDPTRIHVDPHQRPSLEEESFQQLVHDSLQKTPWLGLSLLVHALGLALIILLAPEARAAEPVVQLAVQLGSDRRRS